MRENCIAKINEHKPVNIVNKIHWKHKTNWNLNKRKLWNIWIDGEMKWK